VRIKNNVHDEPTSPASKREAYGCDTVPLETRQQALVYSTVLNTHGASESLCYHEATQPLSQPPGAQEWGVGAQADRISRG
jgi:hypothetical protein